MNKAANAYLEKVDRYLRPLPLSERTDMIQEIKSEIAELEASGVSTEDILARLGDPKVLAGAYLGETITKSKAFSWKKLCAVAAFYSYAGLGGIFLLPLTSIAAVTFMLCGVLCPLAGLVKLVAFWFGFEIPQIAFTVGAYAASAPAMFPITISVGSLIFLLGWLCWKLTVWFIRSVSSQKRKVSYLS